MGFWHTGYMEFHEVVGFSEPFKPGLIRYPCQHCKAVFQNIDDLRRHRFEQHPQTRPLLIVRGIELGTTPLAVTREIKPSDFVVGHCAVAMVNDEPIPVDKLTDHLASFTNDHVYVTLRNGDASATFEIEFAIANDVDLHGVERCFLEVVCTKQLDLRAIEGFIAAAKRYRTALKYCDGVCQYLYGVLAKESDKQCSLRYDEYRDKFTQAVHALSDYDRALAHVIRGLVAFHFNHFDDANALLSGGRIAAASRRFSSWLNGGPLASGAETNATSGSAVEDLLTDIETVHVARWALSPLGTLRDEIADIQALINQDIADFDRLKLRMILAEQLYALGEHIAAKRAAQDLIHLPATAGWAERLQEHAMAQE